MNPAPHRIARIRRAWPTGAALLAAALTVGVWHLAHAGTSILEYDESGHLDQLHQVAPGKSAPGASQAPGTSQAPGEPGSRSLHPAGKDVGPSAAGGAKDPSAVGGAKQPSAAGGANDANGGPVKNSAPETWFEPGEVIVANPPAGFESAVIARGFRVIEKARLEALSFELWRLATPAGVAVPEAVAQLRDLYPRVLLDANHRYKPAAGPDESLSRARAAIGWTGIDAACGRGIRLGMVDTPVDTTHPALVGQRVTFRSFIQPKRTPAPADHGTAIAAMLVGKPDKEGWGGLLPGAELLAGNIFTFDDSGEEVADVIAMVKALDWLAGSDVHAVNLSMAGSDNRILRFAIAQASAKGLVLVAAVGNWGTADRPAYPAAYPQAIGVTAVDANSQIYTYANRGAYVAFAAPGVEMWTAVPGGGKIQSGTSFAVPYLTSLIGADAANGGKITADRFRELLAKTAVDLGAPGRDDTFGWGLVNEPPQCAQSSAALPR
jgi:hypothetical protein